jgi:hypothetical protein
MPTDSNIGSDYRSRVNAQHEQGIERAREAERSAVPAPQKADENKVDETPLTRGEVQAVINSLTSSIKTALGLLATKAELKGLPASVMRMIYGLGYIGENRAREIANETVPPSLRGLDSDSRRKSGDTLRLESSVNGDVAAWRPGDSDGSETTTASDDWDFGIKSSSGANVVFNGGTIIRGEDDACNVSEASLTITETGQIVFVTYDFTSGIAGFSIANASNFPKSGSGNYVKALQSFTLTDGVATKLRAYHRGVIQMDGIYG